MACYRPVTVWKPLDGGPIFWREMKNCREIEIPCGHCIGCRIKKREDWAIRIYCESKMHKNNAFVTLTYDDEHLPSDGGLNYRHIQLLHYKMRQEYGPFRFFVAGEYGDATKRPHYHAIYFGLDFPDRAKCNSLHSKHDLYRSSLLEELWGRGSTTIGEVTYESARYCAVYTTKRIGGELADAAYTRVDSAGEIHKVTPEFARMSLKPGLGEPFLKKYHPEIYNSGHDGVFVGNRKISVPKYFDGVFERLDPDLLEKVKFDRQKEAEKYSEDNTRERRAVKEACRHAKSKFDKERKGNSYDL